MRVAPACAFVLGFGLVAAADLPVDIRAALKESASYQLRVTTSGIPNPVRLSFAKAAGQKSFSMAEPKAQWESTDVISHPELPRRRLSWVALSTSYCVLFYELGGIGKTYRIAVFRLNSDGAQLVWGGSTFQGVSNVAGLLAAIDKGQVNDQSKYY